MLKIYDYFYVGLLVVSIAGATSFARGISNYTSFSYYIYLFLSFLTLFIHKVDINKTIRKLIGAYITIGFFALYLWFAFDDKMIGFLALILPMVFHAYVLVVTYEERFAKIFEEIIVFMTIVALTFWLGNLFFAGTIETIVQKFQFSEAYGNAFGDFDSNVSANIIFYTLPNYSSIDQDDGQFSYVLRNAGFAWEPGAFASILILAMFCNVIVNRFSYNRSLYILIIGLLSSQSTTGFLLFCIFLLFFAYNKSVANFKKLLVAFSFLIGLIITSDIVLNKFDVELDTDYISLDSLDFVAHLDRYSPRRWLSFQIDFADFLYHPFGSGLGQYTWHYSVAENIHTVSGIGKILSYYGVFGFLIFIYYLKQSSNQISSKFDYKGKYILVVFILGILVSYDFLFKPIFAYFWLYYLFLRRK